MAKLWQTKTTVNKEIEKFTVGDDFLLDQKLLPYDIQASIAHAKMLKKIKIINNAEVTKLIKELNNILTLHNKGKFIIKQADEDGHTAIENHLVKKLGSLGKKIHTGRSRNDQSIVMKRLYMKAEVKQVAISIENLIKNINKAKNNSKLPGYTHMQKAMPSSVALLFGAYEDSLKDDLQTIKNTLKIIDQNPLGSAAGYGVNLKLDKKLTTKLLNFNKIQNNPIYCQNSNGKFELLALQAVQQVMLTLNKIASDLMLFTTVEFQFFSLPDSFTTGSSIMPQKKNYDVLELLRAKTNYFDGFIVQLTNLTKNLISGYNRDSQLNKKPLVEGMEMANDCINITSIVFKNLKINKENCKKAMTQELFATDKVYALVKKGMPFRDAYKQVKMGL